MNHSRKSFLLLKIITVLVLGIGILRGQEIWQPTGGPEGGGGVDPSLAIDPASGDYYAIIQGYIYRSQDQAQTWTQIPSPPGSLLNSHLCISQSGYIIVASGNKIYRTKDRGKAWETIDVSITKSITSIFYDIRSGYVLAGVYQEGIIRSMDDGATWAPVNSGLNNFGMVGLWCFYVHSNGALYTGANAASPNSGIYVSTTKGASWTQINGDIDPEYISDIAVNSSGHIFFTTAGSYVYRSINGGTNWIRVTNLYELWFSGNILILPNDNIFVGTIQKGIFSSSDNGSTWKQISLSPGDVEVREMLYDGNISRIITACYGSGILVGSSNGTFWRYYNNGLYHSPVNHLALSARLYASGYGMGIWQLDNMGWKPITYDLPSSKTTCVDVKPDYIFATTMFNGMHRLPESGSSWTDITNGLAGDQVIFTYVAPDGSIYAQTGTVYHFYRSDNNGNTWTELLSGDYKSAVRCMVGKTSQGFYFAGTAGNGVLRSTDGTAWTEVNNGLANLNIRCLAKTVDHKSIFIGTDDGLYLSENNGDGWTKIDTPLGGSVFAIAVNYKGHIFIGYSNNGVYLSRDGGGTWEAYNTGLSIKSVRYLLLDADNFLYTAIDGGGVYKTIRSTTALSIQFSVHMKYQIGFDPANDTVLVRGNFNRWGDDPLVLEPLGDADMTYVGSWTTNRPDTVLSGSMEGTVYFNFSYLDTDMGDEIIETADAKDFNWDGNSDAETPTVWFDDQQMFSRLIYGPVYSDPGDSRGVGWGDYDGDGYQDLVVTNSGSQNILYRNERNGQFTRYPDEPFKSDIRDSSTPAWGDYDNDGDLDLFIANKGTTLGQNNFIYINNGDQTFSKMTGQSIVTDSEYSNGAAWADYDKNGFVDLLVANLGQLNALYKNLGDGTLDRIGVSPFTVDQGASAGCSWADFDNDGDLDLFIANAGSAPGEFNFLYENLGDGQFQKISSANPIVTDKNLSNGGCWGDYNNDGWLDLYVVNREGQPNVLYINQGEGNFVKAPDILPISEPSDSRCASWADYDSTAGLISWSRTWEQLTRANIMFSIGTCAMANFSKSILVPFIPTLAGPPDMPGPIMIVMATLI